MFISNDLSEMCDNFKIFVDSNRIWGILKNVFCDIG